MIDAGSWGWPQWVVVAGFMFATSLNVAGIVSFSKTTVARQKLITDIIIRGGLVALLIFGGFFA